MTNIPRHVVNLDEVEEVDCPSGEHWGGFDKVLTPSMRPKGGRLAVHHSRIPKGHTMCPFHYHEREDEVFFILSGRGILRYGDDVRELRAGASRVVSRRDEDGAPDRQPV
jgi:mannose-6-phosphate isomerase-like protein (cupin superfamily)